ncbi:MAG TPA: OmpH family outer membrane protein [Candidatus Cloacimonadota bacterium]|nr:OmpH family outer membrane protein [Candidatus Cloacimonadota bacterium]
MKKIIGIALLIMLCSVMFAEEKMAYIDTDKIMMESPETQEAQTILLNERQKWEQEINDMDAEIEQLYSDYESKKMILTESGKAEAEARITELTEQRQAKVTEIFGENGKFVQKQGELLEPILKKLQTVIEKVAVENNYTIIFDAAAGGLLYAKPSLDITDQILDEMTKTVEETGK